MRFVIIVQVDFLYILRFIMNAQNKNLNCSNLGNKLVPSNQSILKWGSHEK